MATGIFIRMCKVLVSKDGQRTLSKKKTDNKVVGHFPLDHNFGFDIRSPKNWKIYLRQYRTENGKKLPHKTPVGDTIVYKVDAVGMRKEQREFFFEKTGALPLTLYHSLYPSYESEYPIRKLKDVTTHGRIDK